MKKIISSVYISIFVFFVNPNISNFVTSYQIKLHMRRNIFVSVKSFVE